MVQFRFIPPKDPKYFPNQTNAEIKGKVKEYEDDRKHRDNKSTLGNKNNICKTSFMRREQSSKEKLEERIGDLRLLDHSVDEVRKREKVKQNNKNLSRILGLLNIQRGAVAIQSEKVKVLDSDDEEELINNHDPNAFFLTDTQPQQNQSISPSKNDISQPSVRNNHSHPQIIYTSKNPKVVDDLSKVKKRQDSKIINWTKNKEADRKSFISDIVQAKKFMEQVGPGSYNLGLNVQIHPIAKQNEKELYINNARRLQEILKLKKDSNQIKEVQQRAANEEQQINAEYTKRSKSMMAGGFNIGVTSLTKLQYTQGLQHQNNDGSISPDGTHRNMKNSLQQISQGLGGDTESRFSLVTKNAQDMGHIGPGSYNIPGAFGKGVIKNNTSYKNISKPHLLNKKSPQKQPGRFQDPHLDVTRNRPGPGSYFNTTPLKQEQSDLDNSIFENVQIQRAKYPSFGSREVRELKLINESSKTVPGPGNYQLNFNLEDLLRQCEDKKLVKEILQNLQERKANKVFVSKEPRIAVFQENKIMKEDGMEKYYNQDQNTIAENQLKLSQKKLEKLVFNLKKDYPNMKILNNTQAVIPADNQSEYPYLKSDTSHLDKAMLGGSGLVYNEEFSASQIKYKPTKLTEHNQSLYYTNQKQPSAVFKSGTNRNLTPIKNKSSNINNNTINGNFQQENEYNNYCMPTWDKKSFNMKYSKYGKDLITTNSKSGLIVDSTQPSQTASYRI